MHELFLRRRLLLPRLLRSQLPLLKAHRVPPQPQPQLLLHTTLSRAELPAAPDEHRHLPLLLLLQRDHQAHPR